MGDDPEFARWKWLLYVRDVLYGPSSVIQSSLGYAHVMYGEPESWTVQDKNLGYVKDPLRCARGHLLTDSNIGFRKNRAKTRYCLDCSRDYEAKHRAERKAYKREYMQARRAARRAELLIPSVTQLR